MHLAPTLKKITILSLAVVFSCSVALLAFPIAVGITVENPVIIKTIVKITGVYERTPSFVNFQFQPLTEQNPKLKPLADTLEKSLTPDYLQSRVETYFDHYILYIKKQGERPTLDARDIESELRSQVPKKIKLPKEIDDDLNNFHNDLSIPAEVDFGIRNVYVYIWLVLLANILCIVGLATLIFLIEQSFFPWLRLIVSSLRMAAIVGFLATWASAVTATPFIIVYPFSQLDLLLAIVFLPGIIIAVMLLALLHFFAGVYYIAIALLGILLSLAIQYRSKPIAVEDGEKKSIVKKSKKE